MKIALASVVKGFKLKTEIIKHLETRNDIEIIDLGPYSTDEFVKYNGYARRGVEAVRSGKADRAILICGTGMGMAITANKFAGIHAACCESVEAARTSRVVNNSNVLTMGENLVPPELGRQMVDAWLEAEFQDAPAIPQDVRDFWEEAFLDLDSLGTGGACDSVTMPTKKRGDEIKKLLKLTPDEVKTKAGERLRVFTDIDSLHKAMAEIMVGEIEKNNAAGEPTRWILPVGPFGQYPYFAEMVNNKKLSLKNCHFFFMDEYCDENGKAIPAEHPLSFKGVAKSLLTGKLDPELAPPAEQIIFPDEKNIDTLAAKIESVGGLDVCFGGIGIHGHLAFNEPVRGVTVLGPRKVYLNDYTTTINAVRAEIGGDLENFPREAFTLGLAQIFGARRIVLACRNGTSFDWANTILRLVLFGEPGDDYPVTNIRDKNYTLLTDENTLSCPKYFL